MRDLHGSAGAGGIYTTPGDVAKWMRNLKTGELGGPAVIKELTTSFVLNDGKPSNYGYGVFLDSTRGLRRWQHGGNDVAHSSTFVYYPDLDAGYVVFSNYQGVPGGIAGVVADAFFGQHMTAPQRATATAGVGRRRARCDAAALCRQVRDDDARRPAPDCGTAGAVSCDSRFRASRRSRCGRPP